MTPERLHTLIRLRTRDRDLCVQNLASAHRRQRLIEQRLSDLQWQYDAALQAARSADGSAVLSIPDATAHRRHLLELVEAQCQLETEQAAALAAVAHERALLVAAEQRTQMLERLGQRASTAAAVVRAQSEERERDESWRARQ